MKSISNILKNSDTQTSLQEAENDTYLNAQAKLMVDELFKILKAHTYFLDFKDADELRREWTKTFVVNHITPKLVKRGVDALRQGTARKNITPLEFIEMCGAKKLPAAHQLYISLPAPETSREVAISALEAIKKMLK